MRAPTVPPCTIDRRGAWRWAASALGASAAASAANWLVQMLFGIAAGSAVAVVIGAALLGGAGMLLATRLAPLELAFDGALWRLGAGPPSGRLVVVADLGRWMLLRFEPDCEPRGARWIPLSQARQPRQWHALRCALFAGRQGDAPSPADRGAA